MEKRQLTALELLKIATEHAYCADYLLEKTKTESEEQIPFDTFLPITTLMYKAFLLTFKAFALHEHRPIKQSKNLRELVEIHQHLGFSQKQLDLLKTLSQQQAFSKAIEYDLWETPQQLHIFCEQIIDLYEYLQKLMPIELQADYQSP